MKRFMMMLLAVMLLSLMGCRAEEVSTQQSEEWSESIVQSDTMQGKEVEEIILPDPASFLGIQPDVSEEDSDGKLRRIFYLAPEEETLALQYQEILCAGGYPLEIIEYKEDDYDNWRSHMLYLEYTGLGQVSKFNMTVNDCQVYVGISIEGEEAKMIAVYADGISLADTGERADSSMIIQADPEPETKSELESETEPKLEAEPEPEPEPEPDPEPEPESLKQEVIVNPSSKELPDLMYFLNTMGTEPHKSDGGMQYGFRELPLEYKDVLETELLDLLLENRYQLELVNSYENQITEKTYNVIYDFSYTGTSGLTPLNTDTEGCHVRLTFGCYTKKQQLKIMINYSKEFELTDSGEKTALVVEAEGSTGGGSSIGNWDPGQAEFTKKDCLKCDGDGDCTRCNGYGYIWRDGIKSDCTACNRGNCPKCHGSGKRE